MSSFQAVAILLAVIYVVRGIIQRVHKHSIRHIVGPPAGPWLVGNLPAMFRAKNTADAEFAWVEDYGNTISMKGAFGRDVMLTADPKALQYILNTAGYGFARTNQSAVTAALFVGRGILPAQGANHARQRKIMNPAFSHSALRVFVPLLFNIAQKTAAKWKDLVIQSSNASCVIDVAPWLSRSTLDAIGAAGFDYDFGSLDETQSALTAVYRNLSSDMFFNRSDAVIAFEAIWGYMPLSLVKYIRKLPVKQFKRLKQFHKVAGGVAKSLLETQIKTHLAGKEGGKDVMSILIKANESEDPKTKLSEEEILSQLSTLLSAGHETSANSLSWTLYELSKHPEFQSKVREEIKAVCARAAKRDNPDLDVADLDSMKLLLALIKETLRYHPVASLLQREATRDDIIPLSTPQATKTGEMVTQIPVSKGQRFFLSVAAYNRLKSVWGDDADVWRPERFLEDTEHLQKTSLGVLSNLATFGSGLRACIGWRFAVLEMQTILIELISNFEFSPAPGDPTVIRGFSAVMVPMVKDSIGKVSLPLTVTLI